MLPRMDTTGASDTEPASSSSARRGLGVGGRLLWALLFLVPKNAISRLAGRFAELAWPAPVQRALLRGFARAAGADLSEAEKGIEAYPTLQTFFTRGLKPGSRPLEGGEDVLVSPCDGAWGAAGTIGAGTLVQVKGRNYLVRDLLGDVEQADRFEGGDFATLYLSPKDYHRFHTPAAGRIRRLDYWPGALWPVNRIGLEGIDGLFARNERICAYLDPERPLWPGGEADAEEARESVEIVSAEEDEHLGHAMALVAVGATMVGSVQLSFDDLTTNRVGAAPERRVLGPSGPRFARGEEWGHFEFGSTLVLLVPPDTYRIETKPPGTALRLGEAIGRRVDFRRDEYSAPAGKGSGPH